MQAHSVTNVCLCLFSKTLKAFSFQLKFTNVHKLNYTEHVKPQLVLKLDFKQ